MNVKGTAFFPCKLLLESQFGEGSTSIPMGPFLALQDELLNRHFGGDPTSFFQFGEMSAD